MKKYFLPAMKLTALSLALLAGLYTLILLGLAQFAPDKGQGEKITQNGKAYYTNIGQAFTMDKYFWSRPSAVHYDASESGGSNKAPGNSEYLHTVQTRIDSFLAHNPSIEKSQIPVDLVTASGSGLDPNISVEAAEVQVKRIARVRHLPEQALVQLVSKYVEYPFLGLFGPKKINVLKLNLALDQLQAAPER